VCEFLRGWHRKCGIATLAMALVFAGGWVRSFVMEDFVEFPFEVETDNWSLSGLATENQSLVLYAVSMVTKPDLEPESIEVLPASSVPAISNTEPALMAIEPANDSSGSVPLPAKRDPDAPNQTEPVDALSAVSGSE